MTQIASLFQAELQNIQKSLSSGEQEKVELVKSLACLKDDLTRLQAPEDGSLLDTNMSAPFEKFSSAASQTDLSGELGSGSSGGAGLFIVRLG